MTERRLMALVGMVIGFVGWVGLFILLGWKVTVGIMLVMWSSNIANDLKN